MIHSTTWTNHKNIMLNERSQTQKTTNNRMILFMKFLEKQIHRDRKQTSGCPVLGVRAGIDYKWV